MLICRVPAGCFQLHITTTGSKGQEVQTHALSNQYKLGNMPSNYTKEMGTGVYRQKRYYGNEMGIILLGLSCQEKNMQIQASQGLLFLMLSISARGDVPLVSNLHKYICAQKFQLMDIIL